ncbi:MAG: family 1 extracellular solute-binding protein, partial [Bacilli bacterium]|nr:family 1 extracellular solute-binding protein [Bacilli bacterium]
DLVTKGQVPDIIEGGSHDDPKNSWAPLGVAFDLTPLIQKNKIDLTKFDAAYLQNVRRGSVDGQLDSLPYYLYENVLYYNKTIFDKFGVTYPTDGMTWPQVYELTKKVTQKDANVQYRGLEPDDFARIARQFPLLYLDPKTDKATLTNDKWVNLMTFLKDVYSIPGNLPTDTSKVGSGTTPFEKDQNVAMWPFGTDHWDQFDSAVSNGLNWDMVSYPTWPDAPGLGPSARGEVLGISPTSSHKDQAFKVISYIASEEAQTHLSRMGIAPAIASKAAQSAYGADVPLLKGKHTQALFYEKLAVVPQDISPFDSIGYGSFHNEVINIATGKKDVNTALRDAADALDKKVLTAKQQQ